MKAAIVDSILSAQHAAAKRGKLAIWTIYDRPKDHPEGFIARRFEVGGGGAPVATEHALTGELKTLRDAFESAGLFKMAREAADETQIVESWL
jgi:hypothetical protein